MMSKNMLKESGKHLATSGILISIFHGIFTHNKHCIKVTSSKRSMDPSHFAEIEYKQDNTLDKHNTVMM